jgi:hypothetical protein
MPLLLKSEDKQTMPGTTLYSDPGLGAWAKPTGIYMPPSASTDKGVVDVLLWLHGWYVPTIEQLFNGDRAQVRQQVLSSSKSVVLVAPHLGNGHAGGSSYSVGDLKGHWGELYLNQVLGALAPGLDPRLQRRGSSLLNVNSGPGLRLGQLVIACHSGGGEGMRYLVDSLGRYKRNLVACWGFDCLYGANAERDGKPYDDANFWYDWTTGSDGRPLYVSYGVSTVAQSVKLYLMGQGLVTGKGARRDPEGPEAQQLDVALGISDSRHIDDLMGLDSLLTATTPGHRDAVGESFAKRAADNVKSNAKWPSGGAALMEMHYRIARDGLLERLKSASFV